MTANGDSQQKVPSAKPMLVKIRSSVYMFGNYEVKPIMEPAEITKDDFSIILKLKPGKHDIRLSMSYKHIARIDFLDNQEHEGAGLVLYITDLCVKKIEELTRFEPSKFRHFRNAYAKHAFIIMDILNSDSQTMEDLRVVFNEATLTNKKHLKEQFKDSTFNPGEPTRYFSPINATYFKNILSTLHKEMYLEDVTVNGQKYVSGRIVNTEPNNRCAVQQDGRIIQLNSDVISGRPRGIIDQRRSFAIGRFPATLDNGPHPKIARLSRPLAPRPLASEVHTIEDDAHAEPAPVIANKLIAAYQPGSNVSCKIYDQDLSTLNASEMLNDTIIEFYMNYILFNILDSVKRDRIHIFSTYFFSKLSKDVYTARQPKARAKKISDNYLTLKSWTKTVDVFEKDFLVIPINEEAHWYLAIIAYPNLGIVSKPVDGMTIPQEDLTDSQPSNAHPPIPIFIFDSLLDPTDTKKHRIVAELLLDYLFLEYQDKRNDHHLPGVSYRKNQFKLIIPQDMPQQSNYYDCGIFMLQFAESFLNRLPILSEITDTIVYDKFF
ncbi:putative ubiquitin-like-specific protease 2A [Aphelenchoides besseyi]|nr:putative ubiquitin-like-specific protease 2A [Aphelenchoides besseyi]